MTRAIFHSADEGILNYLTEDGMKIEPEYYLPTVPMVLVNGADGIGTGRLYATI
jgi:DNA topoisomerase-2